MAVVCSVVMMFEKRKKGRTEKQPFIPSYDMPGIQWTYSIPGPLVTSYDMPGVQWTYSIPGPLVTSYDMSGIQWTYSIPGPLVPSQGFIQDFSTRGGGSISATVQPPTLHEVGGGGGGIMPVLT